MDRRYAGRACRQVGRHRHRSAHPVYLDQGFLMAALAHQWNQPVRDSFPVAVMCCLAINALELFYRKQRHARIRQGAFIPDQFSPCGALGAGNLQPVRGCKFFIDPSQEWLEKMVLP